ncbi:hypothetical protein VZT92_005607 [Zoarces viviparus]|uniref:Uncharacterized protein n=1 Tax=Zoarces viviparus TaxID=48416 RepID=A0AAW1FVB6_ZOAVI
MHIIIVVKSCARKYELSVIGAVAGAARGGSQEEEAGVTRRCRCFNCDRPWRGFGHLSIQEGPIGALITRSPVAPSGVRM